VLALALLLPAAAGALVYYGLGGTHSSPTSSGSPAGGAPSTRTLRFHLRGFGTPLPTEIDSGPCPQGRTVIPISSDAGARVGTQQLCVVTISKLDLPHWGLRRIVQTVREIDSLPGGTVVSRQRQTFLFARDQRHSRAIFRGRVVGGSGRYAHLRESVSGGGPGLEGKTDWILVFRLSTR
jgi:hypothetical protein